VTIDQRLAQPRRDSVALAAWVLIALWGLTSIVAGGYDLIEKTVEAHALQDPGLLADPFPLGVGVAIFVLWLMTMFTLAPAGLIVGLIAIAQQSARRAARTLLLVLLVVAGAAAQIASGALVGDPGPSEGFVHDGRLSGLLVLLIGVVVVGLGYVLLPGMTARERRPASAASQV